MARLQTASAESNDLIVASGQIEIGIGGGGVACVCSTDVAHGGSRSFKCASGAGNATSFYSGANLNGAHGTDYFIRVYFRPVDYPASTVGILIVSGGAYAINMTSTGALQLQVSGTGIIGSNSSPIPQNQWSRVELRLRTSASASSTQAEFQLNGTQIAVTSTGNNTTTVQNVNFGWNNTPGANKTIYCDDYAANDSNGANQNTWPGDAYCVLLLPVSDNSIGSWLAGSNATTSATNLWEGINNTPPAGTATSNPVTAAISNKVSGATAPNGDFNLASYTTAGVPSGATIALVQQIIVHGEDVATGSKTGTFAMVSNPAIAAANVADGATNVFGPAGSAAVGAYPTNWIVQRGAVTYNPTVTLGNSPVARITKTDTGTRAADLCFMGLLVEYVPPATAADLWRPWVPQLGPILAR